MNYRTSGMFLLKKLLGLLRSPISTKRALILVAIFQIPTWFLIYQSRLPRPQYAPGAPARIGIGETVSKIKQEIAEAQKQRIENKDMASQESLFEITLLDVELNFVVREGTTDTAAVKTEVLTAGTEREYSAERVQKVTLHLIPHQPSIPPAGSKVFRPGTSSTELSKGRNR